MKHNNETRDEKTILDQYCRSDYLRSLLSHSILDGCHQREQEGVRGQLAQGRLQLDGGHGGSDPGPSLGEVSANPWITQPPF